VTLAECDMAKDSFCVVRLLASGICAGVEAGDDPQVHILCAAFAATDQQRCAEVKDYVQFLMEGK